MSKRDKAKIEKRIQRAIDAMIYIQDMGHGNYNVQRILDLLNSLHYRLK